METLTPTGQQESAISLLPALAIGLLSGLERGWHRQQPEYVSRPAGIRTFGLIGLLGGVAGLLTIHTTAAVLDWAFGGFAAAFIRAYVLNTRETG